MFMMTFLNCTQQKIRSKGIFSFLGSGLHNVWFEIYSQIWNNKINPASLASLASPWARCWKSVRRPRTELHPHPMSALNNPVCKKFYEKQIRFPITLPLLRNTLGGWHLKLNWVPQNPWNPVFTSLKSVYIINSY